MIKKLFLLVLLTVSSMNLNAQSIGFLGAFSGWGNDVIMNTTDNENYAVGAYTFLVTGELKFRQDGAWATNWGAATFPAGVGTQGGANIPVPAGTYNITFNRTTGAYNFEAVTLSFPVLGFHGGFNSFGDRVDLLTADGIAYSRGDYYFNAAGVKFLDNATPPIMWGGTGFPSGTASVGGPVIPLTPGYYNIDLNYTTGAYNFVEVPVSLIGSGAIDFETDIPMTSTDGGVTFSLTFDLIAGGSLKFRTNFNWATNWGGTAFPIGAGVPNGNDNIPVDVSGTYDITFNRQTLAYTFTLTASAFDLVEAVGTFNADGVNANTLDGVTYKIDDYYFAEAAGLKFALSNDATTFWGNTFFPSGQATLGGGEIPVPVGNFNIMFNKTSLAYDFTVTTISITGDGSTGWGNDVYLTSTDNGINFTGTGIVLLDGSIKFRSNSSYAKAWGATTFPTGVASLTEATNIATTAGTYNVTFNRVTGDFNFQNAVANVSQFGNKMFTVFPNPTNNVWNFASKNNVIDSVTIVDISGKTIYSQNVNAIESTVNATSFSNGLYFATVRSGQNIGTYKLVKN
jgi:hypothetical protein